MGFTTIEVVLGPHQPVYFSGQAVSGYIRTTAYKEVSCDEITVTVKGKASVRWTERHGKTSSTYRSEEKYCYVTTQVWNGQGNHNKMPPGDHTFPFSLVLPHNLPSSFEGTRGRVRYKVVVEAERPFFNQTAEEFISVNCVYDLNADPVSRERLHGEKDKTVCCMCCASPVHLEMEAQRKGYVPGQNIVLNGEVVNNSRSTIKYSEAKILQMITYITPTKSRTDIRTVQRVYRPQIVPGGLDEWEAVLLPVPAVPSSHLQHCNIIVIDYYIMLEAKLGCCRVAKLIVPIVIGSIPLLGTLTTIHPEGERAALGGTTLPTSFPPPQPHPNAPLLSQSAMPPPSAPQMYGDAPPPYSNTFLPAEYKDMPPPSYASCVFSGGRTRALGRHGPGSQPPLAQPEESDDDEGGFAPHYITYGVV